jgi:hypothetical protein
MEGSRVKNGKRKKAQPLLPKWEKAGCAFNLQVLALPAKAS